MKRRPFLQITAGTAAALAVIPASSGAAKASAAAGPETLAGMTLKKLRARYHSFL